MAEILRIHFSIMIFSFVCELQRKGICRPFTRAPAGVTFGICEQQPLLFNDVTMPKHALQLDRAKANPLFDSWKLARALAVSKDVVTPQAHVIVHDHSTDYLNTRAAVLHNHLHQQDQRTLVFTEDSGVRSLRDILLGEHVEFQTLWGRLTRHVC